MPIVCDFRMIVGDKPVQIGDATKPIWGAKFSTLGRYKDGVAFLIFSVRGLTYAQDSLDVNVNGQVVGQITPTYFPAAPPLEGWWFTQMIAMSGSVLHDDKENSILIQAVTFVGASGSDVFDDFQIKDMFCFFHQST
jgi:hypothetical protein